MSDRDKQDYFLLRVIIAAGAAIITASIIQLVLPLSHFVVSTLLTELLHAKNLVIPKITTNYFTLAISFVCAFFALLIRSIERDKLGKKKKSKND